MIVKDLSNSFNPVPKSGQKNVKEPAKSGSKNVIKKKSSKLAKLEKNRFSIITKKLDICYICKSNKKEDWHEAIEGKKGYEILETVGRRRGHLVSGGEIDTERTALMLLDEFRGCRIGRISLETPEAPDA